MRPVSERQLRPAKRSLVVAAANDGFEPILPYAAVRMNVCFLGRGLSIFRSDWQGWAVSRRTFLYQSNYSCHALRQIVSGSHLLVEFSKIE